MIFITKYKLLSDKSRYECLKSFLNNFCTLDDVKENKSFYGICDEGEFTFKSKHPNSPLYFYSPKTKLIFNEGKNETEIEVKSSAIMLLFAFLICILFAILFILMALLLSSTRLIICIIVSLLLALLFAFLSAKSMVKTKRFLENLF